MTSLSARQAILWVSAGLSTLTAAQAFAQQAPAPDATTDIVVTAKRLDAARASIQPDLGASTYTITAQAIEAIPGGENTQLNQVVLQMPGVSQDSFGQLHVRDDHNNIQFRLNGVILPEGISVFGQSLSPRIIDKVELITGALPAQYGLRTAGIIDVTTKSGLFDNGGTVSIYGGSHGEYEPSFTYGGSAGATNFFVSGSFLHDQLGIESPDGKSTPDHDRTDQLQGFAYLDHTIDVQNRVSLILGTSQERFQIPNTIGLEPQLGLNVNGQTAYPSAELSSNQRETTDYAIASFLHAQERWSAQVSLFTRYSSLTYRPTGDFGELLYNGISQTAAKQDAAFGLQAEAVYHLTDAHTLRTGVILEGDRGISKTQSYVLPVDANGVQTSDVPEGIVDDSGHDQFEYSYYIQDEWQALHNLTVNYGLRFDEVNAYVDQGQISPRLNVVWTPLRDTTIHAGYSRFFTPPPFELVGGETLSKFANTTAAPQVALDATPSSQREDYYDVGAQQKLFAPPPNARYRWLLPLVHPPARRRPVRRADYRDAVQLRQGPHHRRRTDGQLCERPLQRLWQRRLRAGPWPRISTPASSTSTRRTSPSSRTTTSSWITTRPTPPRPAFPMTCGAASPRTPTSAPT